MSSVPSKHSTDYDNSVPVENSGKRSRMQTLLTKDFTKKRDSVRSAYNSHRPSTTNRTKSSQRELREVSREAHREEKNLDIDNYLDHTIVENQI